MCNKDISDRRFETFDDEIKIRCFNKPANGSISDIHQHSKYEMYFSPTAVQESIHVNSIEILWEKPSVLIVYPYMLHTPINTAEKTHERYYFSFNERTLSAFDTRLVPSILREKISCCLITLTEEQAGTLRTVMNTLGEGPSASERQKELVFMLFMAKLWAICDRDKIQRFNAMESYIFEVLKYIVVNYNTAITSNDLARRFSISRSKLERNFRVATGFSVHQFIDNCRMNHAMRRLASESFVSVIEVAKECGFENETYFYSFFKKYACMSPIEYRRLKKEENKNERQSEK